MCRWWRAACLSIVLGGCAAPPVADKPAVPVWPPPPDTPRYTYEHTLRSLRDLQPVRPTSLKEIVTAESRAAEQPVLGKPYDVAAYRGRIYVTDTLASCVWVFDVPRRRIFRFGERYEGTLGKPLGIAVDREQRVYVADEGSRRIVIYDGIGLFLRAIESELLAKPVDVAVSRDGGRIYVVDMGGIDTDSHRVVVFDANGGHVTTIGRRGSGPGEFNLPTAAAVAGDGTLYVLDAGNFRVQAFDAGGAFLRSFGAAGTGFGQFARPRAIAVDDAGNLLITDAQFGNVQLFTPQGDLLMFIGDAHMEPAPGHYPLLAGAAVDETGRIYLVDQYFTKVEVLRPLRGADPAGLVGPQP
jgi:DNA-binding beta-propeller fold protein YncE